MNYRVNFGHGSAGTTYNVNLRCPACRHAGSFHAFEKVADVKFAASDQMNQGHYTDFYYAGVRRCPNLECNAIAFVVTRGGILQASYPPQVLDFDSTALPEKVQTSLEEAVKCHAAGCFSAAALMVRKTLENLCEDKQATGPNLKERLSNLRKTIVISEDLLAAADELRLLGNDAAHVEAQAYDAIEAEEVEVAIELSKELLKAVYQHTSLVARLWALKSPSSQPLA